ncbi:MAG: hypothetical protein L6R45_36395 [Anaerolineae bacterium]|nr:hypothetical protein [Anaerolineae bacterium]
MPDTLLPLIKEAIFHYVYTVLHDPAYHHKYELNLKREFLRIPFYSDFWQWAEWGRRLLDLHLHYETAPPYPLERLDKDPAGVSQTYKAKLKAVKANNLIELDSLTTLAGIPRQPRSTAWATAPPWNGSSGPSCLACD